MRNTTSILSLLLALGIYGAGPVVTKFGPFAATAAHAESGEGSEGGEGGEGQATAAAMMPVVMMQVMIRVMI